MVKKKSLEWRNCSEDRLFTEIAEWVKEVCLPGTLLFLEGELGAGKSTLARTIIAHLAKGVSSQGSPTFPLVQEYRADRGFPIYHIDLYRLKSEDDLEHSGIGEQIDSPDALVLVEWGSLFSRYFQPYFSGNMARTVGVFRIESSKHFRNYRFDPV